MRGPQHAPGTQPGARCLLAWPRLIFHNQLRRNIQTLPGTAWQSWAQSHHLGLLYPSGKVLEALRGRALSVVLKPRCWPDTCPSRISMETPEADNARATDPRLLPFPLSLSVADPMAVTLLWHKPGSCHVQTWTGQFLPESRGSGQGGQCMTWTAQVPLAGLPWEGLTGRPGSPRQGPQAYVS